MHCKSKSQSSSGLHPLVRKCEKSVCSQCNAATLFACVETNRDVEVKKNQQLSFIVEVSKVSKVENVSATVTCFLMFEESVLIWTVSLRGNVDCLTAGSCSTDTTWQDTNSHCIPGFSFYNSSPPEQDSNSQSPTSHDVEHKDICLISCLMYRQGDTKDYHIRSHRLCEVVFSFWRRQSYLRSGTDLLFQKHMYTTGSICAPRPWLQNL